MADLKGLKTSEGREIRENVLYRSSKINDLRAEDIERIYSLGLKRIIDLRHEDEMKKYPDYVFKDVRYLHYSLLEDNISAAAHYNDGKKLMRLKKMSPIEDTYRDFFTDPYSLKMIKEVIREIVLNHEYPVVWHCVTGKDRAGVITMIILSILGVSREDIIANYMATKDYYLFEAYKYAFLSFIFTFDRKLAKKAADFFIVKEENIIAAYETVDRNFTSMESFIHDYLELSDKDINDFRNEVLK